ncbi:MAG: 4Fe-4S binding protein [Clostridiales Family XIII bacterium]|jgi:O-acetylhomoserine (thiol)-lyase|nr:4Fe-4S binding protein [Clostridiales Family XIII bacterium]
MMNNADLKKKLIEESDRLGLDLIKFGDVERYREDAMIPEEFYPQSIWPWAKTVISVGIQILFPILATTPSVLYKDHYDTVNRVMDDSSYRIAGLLGRLGYRACSISRDGYLDIHILEKLPEASFSHVVAGKYTGLGTIGMNHTLLTPEYGPRVRLCTIITDAEIPSDPLIEKDLCIGCHLCEKKCPANAFTARMDTLIADYDKYKCTTNPETEGVGPCGICTLVCPVGADFELYGKGETAVTPVGKTHVQNFGTYRSLKNRGL